MSSRNYKLEENPPELPTAIEDLSGPWVVVHTKTRCEKLVAQFLLNSQIPYFLPYIIPTNSQGHPQLSSLVPLFPGILFMCAPSSSPTNEGLDRIKDLALKSHKIFSFLHTRSKAGQQTLRSELALIATETYHNRSLENFTEWSDLQNGTLLGRHVEITSPHCCAGLRGHLVQLKNKERFVIQLSFLGRPTSMEVCSKFLKPI